MSRFRKKAIDQKAIGAVRGADMADMPGSKLQLLARAQASLGFADYQRWLR